MIETSVSPQYFAGLIDGEGSITITRQQRDKNAVYTQWQMIVRVSSTHRPVLEMLADRYGGSVNLHKSKQKETKLIPGNVPCYSWQVSGQLALATLTEVLPYLIIKQDQAKLAIEFQSNLHQGRTSAGLIRITEEEADRRDRLCVAIWSLNRPTVDVAAKIKDKPAVLRPQ